MRWIPLFAVFLALPAIAQEVREESRLDQLLEGQHFVVHWNDTEDVALGDAGRVLAALERAYLHAEDELYPPLRGMETFKLDVFVDPLVDVITVEPGFEAPFTPFIRISPGFFALPPIEHDSLLAQGYAAALTLPVSLEGDCQLGEPWVNAIIMAFARPLSPGAAGIVDITRRHLEDGGRFGGEGNLFIFLAWAEQELDEPIVGPALADCPVGFNLDLRREELAEFFIALFLERERLPPDIAAALGEEELFAEPVFAFDFRFDELGPAGAVLYELVEPEPVDFAAFDDNFVLSFQLHQRDGAWSGAPLTSGQTIESSDRRFIVHFNTTDLFEVFLEWNLAGEDGFFEDDCFDECDCFGECGDFGPPRGPCASAEVPMTTPWGLLGLGLLATGTARAGARRRRGSGSAADARRAPRG
jgi:hypothetical protein